MMQQRFFQELEGVQTVLLAGAGGGFDIFTGLPLYFALRAAGKTVHLANLSFSEIAESTGERIGEAMVKVRADTEAAQTYFPELRLAQWFARQGEDVPIYCFDRTGVRPIAAGYRELDERLQMDAVILVDGGTDSLMRGDEEGLGTPEEDIASIAAVDALGVSKKFLVCLGFGIDAFHGVCHAQFLEAVADITKSGGFLGAWSVTPEMPEAKLYREAADYTHSKMPYHASIVNTSILSAIDGNFGDFHATPRTRSSQLFINPLMTLYWAFELAAVVKRNLYIDRVRETETCEDITSAIWKFQEEIGTPKPWTPLPM